MIGAQCSHPSTRLLRVASVVVIVGLLLAAWNWAPRSVVELQDVHAKLTPYRHAWYALPVVMVAFMALGLAMVPITLLNAATGIVFGPVLGPLYALAGSLTSGSMGFALGRWIGPARVEQWGGARMVRVTLALKRNGILAVFLVRKIPLPFTLVNAVLGASPVRFRDFILGTLIGMTPGVVAFAGFGFQLTKVWQDPSPATIVGAGLFVAIPLAVALVLNRALQPAKRAGVPLRYESGRP